MDEERLTHRWDTDLVQTNKIDAELFQTHQTDADLVQTSRSDAYLAQTNRCVTDLFQTYRRNSGLIQTHRSDADSKSERKHKNSFHFLIQLFVALLVTNCCRIEDILTNDQLTKLLFRRLLPYLCLLFLLPDLSHLSLLPCSLTPLHFVLLRLCNFLLIYPPCSSSFL